MESTQVLLITLFCSFSSARVRSDDFDNIYSGNNWNNWATNLNRDIQQQVRSGLSGLDNLGSTIAQQVRQDLSGINRFTSSSAGYGTTLQHPKVNIPPPPPPPPRGNFGGLENLGSYISQQVHAGLKPVRELQAKLRVTNGQGGTTVATFPDKQVIIRDGVIYECSGTISKKDGSCSGTLRRPSYRNKKDFCYANINTVINNWYCISNGGGVHAGYFNGKPFCDGYDNNPTLLISAEDYRNLCGDAAYPVTYKYFGTQPIGEHSSDVVCSNGTPYTCTYTEYRNPNISNGRASIYVTN